MRKIFITSMLLGLTMTSCNKADKAEHYAKEAEELSRQCPRALDEFTTMDSVRYLPHLNRFAYHYSIKGVDDSLLTAQKENLELQLFEQLTNSPDMRPYIADSLSFQYTYHSMVSKRILIDILIGSERFRTHP